MVDLDDSTATHMRQGAPTGDRRSRTLRTLVVALLACAVLVVVHRETGMHSAATGRPRVTLEPNQGPADAQVTNAGQYGLSYDVPVNFTDSSGFILAHPFYNPYGAHYLRLDSSAHAPEVLAVAVYVTPKKVRLASLRQRSAALISFNRRVGIPSAAYAGTTVAGHPALMESTKSRLVTGGVAAEVSLQTWLVFRSSRSIVQITCQWSSHENAIRSGCANLLASLQLK